MKRKLTSLAILILSFTLAACNFITPRPGPSSSSSSSSSSQDSSQSESSSFSSSEQSSSSQESSSSSSLPGKVVDLSIFAFNDFHGNVLDSSSGPGISRLTTFLNKKKSANSLIISQGDMWQGSAESNMTRGELVTDWMNQNDFVSMTLGNHEFDWGERYVQENARTANFPFLAINIYSRSTNQRVAYCEPSVIIEKDDAKIGIIGAIGDCYSSISSDQVEDIYFKVGNELTNLVKNEATKLKQQGCDMIIYSLHDDNSAYDLSLSGDYVDLVLEGHTHQDYVAVDNKGIYHVQGGGYSETLPVIYGSVDTGTDAFTVKSVTSFTSNDIKVEQKDSQTEALFTKYESIIGHARDVIGTNRSYRNSTYLRQLVADLYLSVGLQKWGSSYQVFLGGGYLSCRSPYHLNAGDVTYADLYNLFPFDNDIQLCSITGLFLSRQFVNTTNSNYYVSYSSYGDSNKNSLSSNKTYYIIVDSYSSQYTSNHCTVVDTLSVEPYYARDLLKDYVIAGGLA